jgi:hypothetical protein
MDETAKWAWIRAWWAVNKLDDILEVLPDGVGSAVELQASWDLTDSAIEAAENEITSHHKSQKERQKHPKVLGVEYKMPDPDEPFSDLAEIIDSKLSSDFGSGLDPTRTTSTTAGREPKAKGKSNSGTGGVGSGRVTQQDELVGAAGEFMVYKALKNLTANRIRASAWKSSNRSHFLSDGLPVDDECGYDFAFRHCGTPYEVEVKSTRAKNPTHIHLGPTQVDRANKVAKRKLKTQWQIWIVAEALDNPRIYILENPYNAEQKGATMDIIPQGSLLTFRLLKK